VTRIGPPFDRSIEQGNPEGYRHDAECDEDRLEQRMAETARLHSRSIIGDNLE